MKRNIIITALAAATAIVAGCGLDASSTGDDVHDATSDTVWASDTAGYDALSDPVWDSGVDAAFDAPVDTLSDASSSPDAFGDPATDTAPEVEPLPDDVCAAEVTEPQVLYLSADDSNSMASPIIARSYIENGQLVPADRVRTYEFTNYYDIDYPEPEHGRLEVVVDMIRSAGEEGMFDMQIGVQSHGIDPGDARPMNITLSLDRSGSMGGRPIELLRQVCREIVGSMKFGDVLSMVQWSTTSAVTFDSHMMSGPDDPWVMAQIDAIGADGSTDLSGGLQAAYDLARDNYMPAGLNRVVLISDGGANAGITDLDLIGAQSDDAEAEGIYLVGVGVPEWEGARMYRDGLMDAVTDAGKGAYVFVDSELEAHEIFDVRFQSTMEIAVMDVRVELTLPPWLRVEVFHGEEISTDPQAVEPQHLAPDDAMIFHQKLKGCGDPVPEDVIIATATYVDPVTREPLSDSVTITVGELLAREPSEQILKGNTIVDYAEGLKQMWILRQSGDVIGARSYCEDLEDHIGSAAARTEDPDIEEIHVLVHTVCALL